MNTDYVVPYPHTTHDMFTNVPGKNNVNMYFNGTTCFANDCTDVYLIKISKTSLKDAFNDIINGNIEGFNNLLNDPYKIERNVPLDVNGDMNLAFSEVDAGDYAIFILLNNSDLYKKSILSTTTFQVLDYDSTTTVPSEVIRGNTFNANITLTNALTDTYTYGAALVHESAYYAEMQLKFNGTRAGTNLTLNDVDIIQGYEVLGVGFSSVNITTVLDTITDGIDPIDGSVMNTTSETNNASIAFDTNGLRAGNYILLTEVYNPGDKLVAFSQSEIIISTNTTAPAGITYLESITHVRTYINWTWTDPVDSDFSKVMVYLDGVFQENVNSGVQCYNATLLTPGTTYEIGTRTVDTTGDINQIWVNHTATTASTTDTTAPVISNVENTDPTTDSVTISWITYENSDSVVRYGTMSGNYTNEESNTALVTLHNIPLSGLSEETTYYYMVYSTDASGNTGESSEYNIISPQQSSPRTPLY